MRQQACGCYGSVCVCVSVFLIIKGDSSVYVIVMPSPVLSLPINKRALFHVAVMSEVAFFLHQLRHVNPPAVLSLQALESPPEFIHLTD